MLEQSPPPGQNSAPAIPVLVEGSEGPRSDVSSSIVSDFRATTRVIIELCTRRIHEMAHPELSVIELGELVDVSI